MEWMVPFSKVGSMRKHKPSVPCSVLLSDNYVIVRAHSRNIEGSTNQHTAKKSAFKFLSGFPFKAFLCSLVKKSLQNAPTLRRNFFIHPPLIFATQSLYHYSILSFAVVCLTKVCEHSLLPNVMKDPLVIGRVFLRSWSVKTLILSSLKY